MVVFGALLDMVIVVFLVLVFAKYAGITTKKGLKLVGAAGLLALLAEASSLITVAGSNVVAGAITLFSVLAWIALLIGVILAVVELVQSK